MKATFFIIATLFLFNSITAQTIIEIDGKIKIGDLEQDDSIDNNVVVSKPDGTLAKRPISSLSEFQILSISNDTIFLTEGGFVVLPPDNVDDADADASNELQTISKNGSTVTLSDNGGSFVDAVDDADNDPTNEVETWSTLSGIPADFSDDVDDVNDADADATNELQTISKSGTTVTLSNGGGSFEDSVDDADNDPTNEIETWGTLSGIPSGFSDDMDDVNDADADSTNELQTISKSGTTVTLSNAGGSFEDSVDDADNDPTNEIETWTTLSGIPSGFSDDVDDVNDADADAVNEIQIISKSGSTVSLSLAGGSFEDSVDDADNDPTNEIETWTTLSGIPSGFSDDVDDVIDGDSDPTNEIETWLTLGGIPIGFSDNIDNVDDADNDPTNEIETWMTLSGIPSDFSDNVDNVDDADNDPTNEIETWMTLSGIPSGFSDNVDNVDDADNDPTNEIETWMTLSGIPSGFSDNVDNVDDADADATNELQTISFSNDSLFLSNGNSVKLPPRTDNFYIGQDTMGGFVCYVYRDSLDVEHGLIVSKVKTDFGVVLQTTPTDVGANSSWNGRHNFDQLDVANSPAKAYVINNMGPEWHIPSYTEMDLLMNNIYLVNQSFEAAGLTPIFVWPYMTSTWIENSTVIYYYDRQQSSFIFISPDNGALRILAVKTF